MRALGLVVGAAFFLGGCGLFDTTVGWGRDPETGTCPAELPDGLAPGEECANAKDCASTCCADACGEGIPDFAAMACVDGVCATPEEACQLAVDETDACAIELDFRQADDQCLEPLEDGAAPEEDCDSAFGCAEFCCTCEDGQTTFGARFCDDGECAFEEDVCEAALDENPDLCP